MRQTNRQYLLSSLSKLHPADLLTGLRIIRQYSLDEFHGGNEPTADEANPLFRKAANQWASWSKHHCDQQLMEYSDLLTDFYDYLSAQGMTEEQAEISRIAEALASAATDEDTELNFRLAENAQKVGGLQTIAARSFSWREALACAVALSGAALLQVVCSGEAWKHFVGLLAVLMIAAPVWNLATRYARRSALAPITQASR